MGANQQSGKNGKHENLATVFSRVEAKVKGQPNGKTWISNRLNRMANMSKLIIIM